jgi:hypothetical protein
MKVVKPLLFALALALSAPAFAQHPASTNLEILRQKVKADKKLIVAANMSLSDAEARAFWPVYDAYQADLDKVNRQVAGTITAYADTYMKGPIADDVARKLVADSLAADEAEIRLRRAYIPRMHKVLPPAKVARYLQIESKLRAVVRYEMADAIPLAE